MLNGRWQVGFQVAAYDATQRLIIDPVLVYSTYLGGSLFDRGEDIAVDSSGNAYVTGRTFSTDFPTASPFQAFNAGTSTGDVFVTKLNAAGNAVVYSTYLGGSDDDFGPDIAVDSSGSAYVTGRTDSTDFPTTNPFQATFGGGTFGGGDAFVTKLNATGSALVYSTYLGGSGNENTISETGGIAVDASGNAYVTGDTASTDFPTASPFQAALGGTSGFPDAFVTKLNAAGSALVYSTYLGGSGTERGFDIALDASGNAYVTGDTNSTDFPTASPIQGTQAGGDDAFVAKFNPAGSALVYSTFLGGSSTDESFGIAIDTSGNAYIAGETFSTDFPTVNPFQAAHGGGGTRRLCGEIECRRKRLGLCHLSGRN